MRNFTCKSRKFVQPSKVIAILMALPGLASCKSSNLSNQSVTKADQQPDLSGEWIVTDLRVDTGATRTLAYSPHDPETVGRSLIIKKDGVVTNLPEGANCQEPKYADSHQTLAKTLADTAAPRNTPPTPPAPKDYDLADQASAPIIIIKCRNGSLGPNPEISRFPFSNNSNWAAQITDHIIALHWYDGSILLLSRKTTQTVHSKPR